MNASPRALRSAVSDLPLRVQLVAVVVALVVLALGITGFAAASALQGYLVQRVDNQLYATATEQQQGRIAGGEDRPASIPEPRSRFNGPALTSAFFTEVVDTSGAGQAELRLPKGSAQSPPRLPSLTAPAVAKIGTRPVTVPAQDSGHDWRVLVRPFIDGSGAVVVGTDLSDIDNTVGNLERVDLGISAVVLAILCAVGYLLVRSRLKKLVEVERTAGRIAEGDLSQRVPNAGGRSEVGHLAAALNTMLSQIEDAFAAQRSSEAAARASEQRMRRFIADASHELRTPLTSIRGFAELQRQGAAVGVMTPEHLLGRVESEAKRMGVLVEDLLLLARLDQQRPLDHNPVDLVDVVTDAVDDAPAVAPDHNVTLNLADDARASGVLVIGDDTRLRQVVGNLMTNAYTHTPAGTNVTVGLYVDGNFAVIEVADTGPGLEPADVDRVFERFYRADLSRNRASGGSGLGLSIVRGIVEAHDGEIRVASEPDSGACFSVRLPLAPTEE